MQSIYSSTECRFPLSKRSSSGFNTTIPGHSKQMLWQANTWQIGSANTKLSTFLSIRKSQSFHKRVKAFHNLLWNMICISCERILDETCSGIEREIGAERKSLCWGKFSFLLANFSDPLYWLHYSKKQLWNIWYIFQQLI